MLVDRPGFYAAESCLLEFLVNACESDEDLQNSAVYYNFIRRVEKILDLRKEDFFSVAKNQRLERVALEFPYLIGSVVSSRVVLERNLSKQFNFQIKVLEHKVRFVERDQDGRFGLLWDESLFKEPYQLQPTPVDQNLVDFIGMEKQGLKLLNFQYNQKNIFYEIEFDNKSTSELLVVYTVKTGSGEQKFYKYINKLKSSKIFKFHKLNDKTVDFEIEFKI